MLIDTASSWRDKAILTLLSRTGQRIGDWSTIAGRHGVLGMTLDDIDRKRRTITVRLKGARDEHRVPITDYFWPLLDKYLSTERRASGEVNALWIAARKGQGKALCYATFESSLRYIARKAGVMVHPHLFRHTLAQGVLDTTGNIKVVQEILGHAHLSTTADLYMRVDQHAMVSALAAVGRAPSEVPRNERGPPAKPHSMRLIMTTGPSRNSNVRSNKPPGSSLERKSPDESEDTCDPFRLHKSQGLVRFFQ